jgi:hypothetical protein
LNAPGKDPLVIKSLEFIGPMATAEGWRPTNDLPEVAFAGRSNVGKSSLFNRLLFRRDWPHFVAFDVLAIDGEGARPLLKHKRRLRAIMPRIDTRLVYMDHLAGRGSDLFAAVRVQGEPSA